MNRGLREAVYVFIIFFGLFTALVLWDFPGLREFLPFQT